MFNTNTATQKPKNNGTQKPKTDFGPVPQGQHVGRVVRMVGLGLQDVSNKFNPDAEPATVFQVTIELPNERITVEDKDGNKTERPRWIWSNDIPIKFFKDFDSGVTRAHEKSKLNKFMSAVFGSRDWTPEAVAEFLPQVVGKEISVFVAHSQSKKTGKVYDKIQQFLPVMKGMEVPELENDTLLYNPYDHDQEAFDKLPPHMKERINNRLDKEEQAASEPQPESFGGDSQYDGDDPFADDAPF